jgi:multidrug transporter EmrE-like cation transporter
MNFIVLIILLSLTEFVGDANFKIYSRTSQFGNLVMGILAYIVLVKILIEALKQHNLIITNGMWNAIQTITQTVLAYFILKERLTNWQQWAGLGSIVFGVIFLNYGTLPK